MPSKPHYKYLFGHPTATWAFSKLQGLQEHFLEILRRMYNLKLYDGENFSDYSSHHIIEIRKF